jgi:type III secretion protein K
VNDPLHEPQREQALRMARLLVRFNVHPESDVHPSWLPADWPVRHRQAQQLGPAGREVLGALLRRKQSLNDDFDSDFTSPRERLALLDGPALRQLAWYCGLGLHRGLWRERPVGPQLRRQARRFGADGAAYAAQRMPDLPALRANGQALLRRPAATGRLVWRRGARVLLALLAQDGPQVLARVRLKLPRRLAAGEPPWLEDAQLRQLEELACLSIVPERLPTWGWLF